MFNILRGGGGGGGEWADDGVQHSIHYRIHSFERRGGSFTFSELRMRRNTKKHCNTRK